MRQAILADARAQLGVGDAEPLARREAQRRRSFPRDGCAAPRRPPRPVLEGEDRRERRHDLAVDDRLVRGPRLAVVREVRALDGLQLHPEVTVVVLDHVAARRGTRDDRAAALRHEDARAHRGPTRMLEDDVGVITNQRTNVLAESTPLALVLGVLVLPEAIVHRCSIDDVLAAEFAQRRCFRLARHDADGHAAGVEDVLDRERAEPARRAPHEDLVALGDPERRCARRACGRPSSCTAR